jgi:hypothetical protein
MQLLSFGPERATPISEYRTPHASAVALASNQKAATGHRARARGHCRGLRERQSKDRGQPQVMLPGGRKYSVQRCASHWRH